MIRIAKAGWILSLTLAVPATLFATGEKPAERPAEKVEAGPSARPVLSIPLGSLPIALQPNPYVDKAEDRKLFREAMDRIGLESPRSAIASSTPIDHS